MAQRELIKTWQEIEKDSREEQRRYLASKLQGRESISRYSDIKLGDHLVTKSGTQGVLEYEHHFLCSGFDNEGVPTIIHSYETEPKAKVWPMILTSYFGSGSSLWKKGRIQEASLQDYIKEDDLQAKGREVERVVWPDDLWRFSAEEVVRRARKRNDEQDYDLMENNCESFVMWCLCDLNISLQVTITRKLNYEMACESFQKWCFVLANVVILRALRRILAQFTVPVSEVLKEHVVSVFLVLGYEAVSLGKEIYRSHMDWKCSKAIVKKMAVRVLLGLLRAVGNFAGIYSHQQFISACPTLGILVGVYLGSKVVFQHILTGSVLAVYDILQSVQRNHSETS
ncbi:uncharacterized protein LOC144627974 [Oculina patagonica]